MRPVLHGVRLSLNAASAKALAPWLDSNPALASGPTIEVELLVDASEAAPAVLETFIEEPVGWLGRTASGLVVGNHEQAWFTIEDSPPRIRGVLGRSEAARELLFAALIVALRSMGVYLVHAAAVSLDDQALVLIGDSGAGKSTTAIALVSAGCSYIGDDGCLIRHCSGDVELLPLWSSFRLTDQSLASFSALRPHSSKLVSDEKWKLNVLAAFPDRHLPHWLGRKTLLFVGRSAQHSSSLQSLSQAEAVGLLIAQSNALSLGCHPNPRAHLDLLARLVSVAHIARLQLGTEWLTDHAGAASRLLEQARSFSRPGGLRSEAS
jgi:hypothetical protein